MKDPAVSGPLEDLAESVEKALELVNECHCQQEHATFLRRLWSADDMARELRQVQEDIGRKLQLGTFALMVAGEGRRRRSKMMAGKDDDDGPAIGIDLGTTYSCVRARRPNHPILRRLHRLRAPRRRSRQEPGRQEHEQYGLR